MSSPLQALHAQLTALMFPWNNGITLFQGNMTPWLVEWSESDSGQFPEIQSSVVLVSNPHNSPLLTKINLTLLRLRHETWMLSLWIIPFSNLACKSASDFCAQWIAKHSSLKQAGLMSGRNVFK
jgi:hypothetical protein